MSGSETSREIAIQWLSTFVAAIAAGDVQATVANFLPDGWLRDSLVFTMDARSLEGHDKISSYLANTLAPAKLTNIHLDERPHLQPDSVMLSSTLPGVELAFTFDAPAFVGRGYVQLARDKADGVWRALSVFVMMDEIKGHEEQGPEFGVYSNHTLAWEDGEAERRAAVEANPYAVIIGAGQTGLNVAARFKQMNIPTIVIEQNSRVGDNWRKRYPTLSLHTTRNHHTLLYQPFPKNWPQYTPRDKVANWLEQYVDSQDLLVWLNSYIIPTPTYDPKAKRWSIVVNKNGRPVSLQPAHLVVAIGTLGAPRMPEVKDRELFAGTVVHASQYAGGRPFAGKHAIIVGAGNTAADISQDLVYQGAKSVTMVQRSSTCVVALETVEAGLAGAYPDGVDLATCDFKFSGKPLGLLKKTAISEERLMWEREKKLHEHLIKGGLALNMGPEGQGQLLLVYERAGGYWLDVGAAELIGSGRIKVKQGVQPVRYTEKTIVFSDGSELDADVVVYSTGYHSARESLKPLFGEAVIGRTDEQWGLDAEGELRGCYRPSGQPGLWYASGDFATSRFLSKQLALQIKAAEIGLA